MRIVFIIVLLFVFNSYSYAQVNCYIFPEGSGERKACEICDKAITFPQGSRASQQLFDDAIAIGPKFDWAYYEKSVPYFKRGFILEGLSLLNKAIALKPLDYLCYRAYWYWQYKNYDLCIKDLETYYAMPKAYLQLTPGGEKDMRIILGLAYAKTGNFTKGINIINTCLKSYASEDDIGLADYYTLGMLYVMNEEYYSAIESLDKQLLINEDLAETYYYLGLAYKGLSNTGKSKMYFKKALLKFEDYYRYYNVNAGFKVYKSDIEKELLN